MDDEQADERPGGRTARLASDRSAARRRKRVSELRDAFEADERSIVGCSIELPIRDVQKER